MSIDATNWAWTQHAISPAEKLVLLAYADRAGETCEAWPSWSRLELDTGLNRKTIAKVLDSIQQKGKMIKTGDKRGQVHVYKLVGVEGREARSPTKKLSTTSTKNGTSQEISTSTKNGTTTSTVFGTTTSTVFGTKNHKKNPKRNPKGKLPFFSSFFSLKEFQDYIKTLIEETGKSPVELLTAEVAFYADKFKDKRDPADSARMAAKIIQSGKWKTPHGFDGITSQSIREKEEAYEREKQTQIQTDSRIGKSLHDIVKHGSHLPSAERLKLLKEVINAQ